MSDAFEPKDRPPFWQITDKPERTGGDYIAWLRTRTGIHVKVSIGAAHEISQEDAWLIVQQFAGILTPFGLENMITMPKPKAGRK